MEILAWEQYLIFVYNRHLPLLVVGKILAKKKKHLKNQNVSRQELKTDLPSNYKGNEAQVLSLISIIVFKTMKLCFEEPQW